MSKLYKILLAILIVGSTSLTVSAQDYWSSETNRAGITTHKAVARLSFPTDFKLYSLNIEPLRQTLFSIIGANASRHSATITLPNVAGQMEQFEVYEASNFEPALQAQFPEIRAYSGRSISDPASTLKISISPQGIQTMVFRAGGPCEYIEPYSQDNTVYAVFHSQRNKGALPWVCSTPDQQLATSLNAQVNRIESNVGQLKTMRLAQSCNGEYSNYFGATSAAQVALVLAAYNATLTRCNGCYEKDLAIHLNLIANTTAVIYYDPATDPYTTLANWNNQLQATLTANIGEANYDIGHMFGASGGGGNAGCIGCVCVDGQKGRGITSPADGIPQGDNFDIDYVAHEVGHQMGANHTFSMSNEGTGVNKEVGSGITIMGYAGITNQDVAPHSIDIFNMSSIQQIQVNMAGKTCPITTSLTGINATPVIAALSNWTIPISTPFELTGSATDADPGDVLTYCWEQNDDGTGQTGNNSVARENKPTGPNWLSFSPTTSGTRMLPRLSTVLGGLNLTPPLPGGDAIANIEALSNVARTLNFRLTVRDNRPYNGTAIGQTNFQDNVITVSAAVGPFLITSQNAAVSYQGGSSQTVTWSVNGTTGAPTNTANVRILWSSNAGISFPTVLVASTPNDGSEVVTMPAGVTSEGRIRVEAIGNIYFDINNANISITPPPSGFTLSTPAAVNSTCPTPATLTTNTTATYSGGHSANITLSAISGVPAGTNVTFGTNPLTTGSTSTTINLNNANTLAPGTYNITIQGVSAPAANQTIIASFTITPAVGPPITLQPTDQTVCIGTNATFTSASPTATGFQWYVNSGAGFNIIPGATSASYTVVGVTAGQNLYQYRVIASTACGTTTSNSAVLNVNSSATISAHPAALTICEGANTSMSVTATTAIGTIVYQWQVSVDNGANWINLAGATTNTFNQTGVLVGQNGYRFRVVLTTGCGSINSNDALLTVNAYPKFEFNGLPKQMCISDPSFALSATIGGGVWSGPGVAAGIFVPKSAGTGVKTVTYTATNAGCVTAKSTVIQVDECPDRHRLLPVKEAVLIYPNPNLGNFSLRMNSDLYTKLGVQVIGTDGKVFMTKEFTNLVFGSVMPMDLTSLAQGTYLLYMYNDENGFVKRGDGVVIYKH
ncbi:MAG: peptidase [Chitinophagaceae bacterium]|nr:peptidase [Chitinophagaceae bacterium]